MSEVKQKFDAIKNHLGRIKPPMPAFVYDDIIGLFPRDEQGLPVGESCVDVLRRHFSTEIGGIETLLSEIETLVESSNETLKRKEASVTGALLFIESLQETLEKCFLELEFGEFESKRDRDRHLHELMSRLDNDILCLKHEIDRETDVR